MSTHLSLLRLFLFITIGSCNNCSLACFLWYYDVFCHWRRQMWCARSWRCRSVCYFLLITTALVVATITFYDVLWPFAVSSLSGPGSSALVLWPPLICFFDLHLWSIRWSGLLWSTFYLPLLWSGLLSSTVGRTRRHLFEGFQFPC
jgi:hypothetical protein